MSERFSRVQKLVGAYITVRRYCQKCLLEPNCVGLDDVIVVVESDDCEECGND